MLFSPLIITIIIITIIKKINSKIYPGEYLDYDSNFEDENINPFERYHYITGAFAAKYSYIDEYSGVYYTPFRGCGFYINESYYNYENVSQNYKEIYNFILPEYKEKTKLQGLIKWGCTSVNRHFYRKNNFPIIQKREDNNASYSVIFRLANIFEWDINITIAVCYNYTSSLSSCINFTDLYIPSYGFLKYHIKWSNNYISFRGEDDLDFITKNYNINQHSFIVIYNIDYISDEDLINYPVYPYIYLTSILYQAELFTNKLSLTGNRMNFCENLGCINDNNFYTCTNDNNGNNKKVLYCYHNISREMCSLKGCVPGSFCNTKNSLYLCTQCDVTCNTCDSEKPNDCTSCYATAIAPQWYSYVEYEGSQSCIHEYIPFNNFENFEIEIPLILNYRATVEFWMFIINTKAMTDSNLLHSYSAFIFKNFFTIVINHNINNINDVEVSFLPLENIYPYHVNISNEITYYNLYKNFYPTFQKVNKIFEGISSKWVYVRVGFSYTHQKMYVNENEAKIKYPKLYQNTFTTYQSFMRKFYRKNEKGILRVQGFQYLNTDIYIRNFNCYADYLDFKINNPNYYNMHSLNFIYLPYLLFVIPFNDIIISSNSNEANFTLYDYSNQFNYETINQNYVIKTDETIILIPTNLSPSKNFRRFKFLELNKYYKTTDLDSVDSYKCNTTNGLKYCYDDETPFVCNDFYNLFNSINYSVITNLPEIEEYEEFIIYEEYEFEDNEYDIEENEINEDENEEIEYEDEEYEDDNDENDENKNKEENKIIEKDDFIPEYLQEIKCVQSCKYPNLDNTYEIKYMRLPSIKINQNTNTPYSSDICNYECDSRVQTCPTDIDSTKNKKEEMQKFKCYSSYITLFYQCLSKYEYKIENSGLQFSSAYKTKSMYFPLIKGNENPISNYIIEMWFHPDMLTQKNPPYIKQFIFMADTIQIYFDIDSQKYVLKSITDEMTSITQLGLNIYYYGWNHLIILSKTIIIEEKPYTQFDISLTNIFNNVNTVSGINSISKICFCNIDELCCGTDSNVSWLDMFIKEIKFWDARFVGSNSLFDFNKFSHINPGGLLQWYVLTVDYLNNNIIKSKINDSFVATFPYDEIFLNPHGDQNFNYGFNFNWNDINYPYFLKEISVNSDKKLINIIDKDKCYEGCSKCYGNSKQNCFECKENYALNGATCTLTSKDEGYFYYINPLKQSYLTGEINDEFELDFRELELNNYPGLTVFFYIKLYGFTSEQVKNYKTDNNPIFDIIYFSNNKLFKLSYDTEEKSLKLILNDNIQFKYNSFLENIGTWIPISISAYRSFDETFHKNFNAMTVKTTPLEYYFSDYSNKIYEKLIFETFRLSRMMIGHISDVTLFKSFIINALGYASHKDNPNSIFSELNPDGLNIIIKTFPLKYKKEPIKSYNEENNEFIIESWPQSTSHCLDETLYIENANNNIKTRAKCVEDYLTYTDQNCNDLEYVKFNTDNTPPICVEKASNCENINQILLINPVCDYLYTTCDNWSVNSIKNLIFLYEKSTNINYIRCGNAFGLDVARFKENSVPNILSPTNEFKMEFWFLSQSYVGNNFEELTINWNNHVKIIASYDRTLDQYSIKCYGLNSEDNEVSFSYNTNLESNNKWRYVVCGVNIEKNEIYTTDLEKENQGPNYRKSLVTINIPTTDLTTLTINENSPTNFGVTYIKELRLWKCYDCSSDKAFISFNKEDEFFKNVIHYFKFEDPTGLLKDYRNNVNGDDNIKIQFETKDDFTGYGLLNPIPDTPNCNEKGALYYSFKLSKGCDTMINFNVFKNDIIFDNIPSSKANRYTMDFWFFIENPDDFTKGLNVIYQDHITISTYAKNKNENDLIVYCFPQSYRNNLLNIFGDNILQRFNVAQNKVSYTYVNGYSKWNYVRCGYSFDLQKYYINDNPELDVQGEIFFSNPELKKNEKSFKMFMNNFSKLIINVSKQNFVRIFFQTINIFRDYIPPNIETKYIKMKEYITSISNNVYYPLLFAVDFTNDYNIIYDSLKYYITDYDFIPTTNQIIEKLMLNVNVYSYTTYPFYDPFLQCGIGKIYKLDSNNIPYCEFIINPPNCNAEKIFCLDNNKFFWCEKNKYLDINTYQCNSDCPEGYTRPSDVINGYGMCYIKASDMHYYTYPKNNEDLIIGNYENNFQCDDDYVLVNYHCVKNYSNSAIYFNNKYHFSNTIAYFNKLLIKNYYVDFWLMLDMTETYRYSNQNLNNDENTYQLFIAFPHFISRYKQYIQYSNGYIINKKTNITTLDKLLYKWNHFVIENYEIEGPTLITTFKYVNIYLNNDYNNPIMSLKINNNNDFSLCQIAFCSGANDKWTNCFLGLDSIRYKAYHGLIWEDAFYKEIIIWNQESTGISSINNFNSNSHLTTNIIAYYPFSVDTIKNKKIESKILYKGNTLDFIFLYNNEIEYDHSAQINWVNNFDITIENKYIQSIDNSNYINKEETPYFSLNTNSYITNECTYPCMKCFGEGSQNCINCMSGYLLEGTKCVSITRYYLNTPIDNDSSEPIEFKFDFSSFNEVTFMIYIKFLGIINIENGIIPLIYFYNKDNYFGWDIDNNQFIVVCKINGQEKILFKSQNSNNSIGKWSLYSISIYLSNYDGIFPNMIQLMIDNISINPELDLTEIGKTRINFNKISISNIINALFYDLRIYNKFFIGPYSLGQQYDTSFEPHLTYLQKRYLLTSITSDSNCLLSSDVNNYLGSNSYCVGDINRYDDTNYECNGDSRDKFRLIDSISEISNCEYCDSYCINKCYDKDKKGCLCTYDNQIYLFRYNKSANINEGEKIFYCQKPDILNLNEYNNIQLNNIEIGSTTSYMIDFWVYVYSYIDNNNFRGGTIEWTHFIKIDIYLNNEDNNYLDIICYPYSDELNYEIKENLIQKVKEWVYIQCKVDKENLLITLNKQSKNFTTNIITELNNKQPKTGKTTLILKDYNTLEPYGMFLIRQLRLWNTKSNLFYDISHINLKPDSSNPNIVHFFKNKYEGNDRKYIYDVKNNITTILNDSLINPYPYSYISEKYIDLILCDEGKQYKKNEITNLYECSSYTSEDILKSINEDKTIMSPSDLSAKIDLILEMAINNYENPFNSEEETKTKISVGKNGEFKILDPEVPYEYCSNHGEINIIDHTPVCYCIGDYSGKYCQISSLDMGNINSVYSIFLDKLKGTYSKYNNNPDGKKKIITALKNFIDGVNLSSKDDSILTELIKWLSSSIIYDIKECDEDFIQIIDKLYRNNFDLINDYKIINMKNGIGSKRNSELTQNQEKIVSVNSESVKSMFEYLTSLCFLNINNNKWNFKSENAYVDLIQINNNFDIDSYLKNKKEKEYLPYFQIGNCLNDIKKSTSETINIQFVTWLNSPYYWNTNLYWNYTSHYIEIKLYDDQLKEIKNINQCSNENNIEFYFTLNNPNMAEILNENIWHFYKENMFSSEHQMFTYPKFIDEKGNIDDTTREDRINKYYFEYILEFDYLNKTNLSYNSDGLSYDNITDNYYLKCSSNHLSEFMLNYVFNPYPSFEKGRLFFLSNINIYKNFMNYKKNIGFYLLIFIAALYLFNLIFCVIENKKKLSVFENKRYKFINLFLLLYVYPYGNDGNEYIVNKKTGNKIYNEDYNIEIIHEKNILYNQDILTLNKKGKSKKKNKKKGNTIIINRNYNINLGNVKSKKIYTNFFNQMKDDDIESENTEKMPQTSELESNKSFDLKFGKKSSNEYTENKSFSEKDEQESQFNKNLSSQREHLYMNKEELEKNKKEFISNLKISNENQRIIQYLNMKMPPLQFFKINCFNRNILSNTWKSNATYGAKIKALFLPFYLQLILFMNTLIYIFEKKEMGIIKYLNTHFSKFFFLSIVPIIFSNIYFYLKGMCYNIDNGQIRSLLNDFQTDKSKFDPEYRLILKKFKIISFFETILFCGFFVLNFFLTIGLCCVYKKQGKIMFVSFCSGILIDFILDLVIELFIMVLYIFRKYSTFGIILDKINRLRSLKMLSP